MSWKTLVGLNYPELKIKGLYVTKDEAEAMCERLAGALERGRWSVTKEQSVEAWGDLNEALAAYNAMLGKGE